MNLDAKNHGALYSLLRTTRSTQEMILSLKSNWHDSFILDVIEQNISEISELPSSQEITNIEDLLFYATKLKKFSTELLVLDNIFTYVKSEILEDKISKKEEIFFDTLDFIHTSSYAAYVDALKNFDIFYILAQHTPTIKDKCFRIYDTIRSFFIANAYFSDITTILHPVESSFLSYYYKSDTQISVSNRLLPYIDERHLLISSLLVENAQYHYESHSLEKSNTRIFLREELYKGQIYDAITVTDSAQGICKQRLLELQKSIFCSKNVSHNGHRKLLYTFAKKVGLVYMINTYNTDEENKFFYHSDFSTCAIGNKSKKGTSIKLSFPKYDKKSF